MSSAARLTRVRPRSLAMIAFVCRPISRAVSRGQNDATAPYFVPTVPTNGSARTGGAIRTTARFYARISIASMKHGFATVSS